MLSWQAFCCSWPTTALGSKTRKLISQNGEANRFMETPRSETAASRPGAAPHSRTYNLVGARTAPEHCQTDLARPETSLLLRPCLQESLELLHPRWVFVFRRSLGPAAGTLELGPLRRRDRAFPVDLRLQFGILAHPHFERLGWFTPGNGLPDQTRRIRQDPGRPVAVVIVDDAQHRRMDVEREVHERIVQPEQLEANAGQVVLAARQEKPARPRAVAFGIGRQLRWCIFVRLQREGIHEHVAAQVVAEQVL